MPLSQAFNFERSAVIESESRSSLSDAQFSMALDKAVGVSLEAVTEDGGSVLIIVSANNPAPAIGQALNLTVRRLIANGVLPYEITIIFSGLRSYPLSEAEKKKILTPFIYQRVKSIEHRPRDLMMLSKCGQLDDGSPLDVNKTLNEFDKVIVIGSIKFDEISGFSGGADLIAPGLASVSTHNNLLKLFADLDGEGNRGKFLPNTFADSLRPYFYIGLIENEKGESSQVFCGEYENAFRKGCESLAGNNRIDHDLSDVVFAPSDAEDLYFLLDDLFAACGFCRTNGKIYIIAEKLSRIGDASFANFLSASVEDLKKDLGEKFSLPKYKAYKLQLLSKKFSIFIVSDGVDELSDIAGIDILPSSKFNEVANDLSGILLRAPRDLIRAK